MKAIFLILSILCVEITMVACQTKQAETMVLLNEKDSEIKISQSKGFCGMNEEFILSFKDKKSLDILQQTVTTTR